MTKAERFQLFLERLGSAPAATNHDESFTLLARTLNAIEDEHSGVSANPSNWQFDGRMYPPQADMARSASDLPGVTVYRSRSHRTFIGKNGAVAIVDVRSGEILFEKHGKDGGGIWPDKPSGRKNPT